MSQKIAPKWVQGHIERKVSEQKAAVVWLTNGGSRVQNLVWQISVFEKNTWRGTAQVVLLSKGMGE